ncbi:MAG: hypothetical protein ACLVJ6_04945 [Merdibacter sp.]
MVIISEKNSIITVRDARIIHRNFAGEERKFNAAGRRNFNLILMKRTLKKLAELGLNVRVREPRDELNPDAPAQGQCQLQDPPAEGRRF